MKADIDRHAVKAMKDREKFIKNVLLSMNESSAERSEKARAEIDKLKKRNAELDRMYIRLYEDYSGGRLSEKKFTMMSAHYEHRMLMERLPCCLHDHCQRHCSRRESGGLE